MTFLEELAAQQKKEQRKRNENRKTIFEYIFIGM